MCIDFVGFISKNAFLKEAFNVKIFHNFNDNIFTYNKFVYLCYKWIINIKYVLHITWLVDDVGKSKIQTFIYSMWYAY